MAQFCAQCGAPLEDEAHFCAECGHLVGAAPTGGESGPSEIPTPEPAPKATVAEPAAVAGAGGAGAGGAGSSGGGVGPSGGGSGGGGRRVLIGVLVLALVAGGVVAGVALSGGEEAGANEITLEPAGSEGRDPFTSSTVTDPPPDSTSPTVPPPPPPLDTTAQGTERSGGSAGLYGGSLNQGACDVEKQIAFLEQNPAKARAFAGVLGISAGDIPAYLRGLTPMILRYDTRVTNHGFLNGRATPRQSVLQAGTAVLVDRFGVPRVKCGCGNPLTPPLDLNDKVTYFGEQWDGFSLRDTTIVIENNIDIDIFILVDFDLSEYYRRLRGDDGTNDTLGGGADGGTDGGRSVACPATADEAVARLLKARRDDDKVAAATKGCGTINVIDYLWALSDDFAGSLRAGACVRPEDFTDPSNTGTDLRRCTLSNGVTLVAVSGTLDAPIGGGWIVNTVITTPDAGGGSTTGSTAPKLVPGAACALGSSPDCIDPDGDGQGVYLLGGAQCMAAFPDSPDLCSDLDGDGRAGYPDSG